MKCTGQIVTWDREVSHFASNEKSHDELSSEKKLTIVRFYSIQYKIVYLHPFLYKSNNMCGFHRGVHILHVGSNFFLGRVSSEFVRLSPAEYLLATGNKRAYTKQI